MDYCIINGVDLAKVGSMIFRVLEKDTKFFEKLFTPREISYCFGKKGDINQALSFTARLAAKGAVAKMLGLRTVEVREIEVVNNNLGKPEIKLYGEMEKIALKIGLDPQNISISLSDTDELVVASAVALIKNS